MKIKEAIQQIIDEIPAGHIFDSHFVIDRLIEKHSDEYLEFAGSHNAETNKTSLVHAQIGRMIATWENPVLERVTHQSSSKNIHGTASECACWRKR